MVSKNEEKHQKVYNDDVVVGEGNRLSSLPDELIHHILSFLPIKCAMSTCILSKRWKYLSNSIPTLDFREWRGTDVTTKEENLKTQQFMDFLDTVLYHHEKQNIQKFCLNWDNYFSSSRITKWIDIVAKRKVKELFLFQESHTTPFTFSLSFFTCDSLTVLDLNDIRFFIPETVFFPKLKILRLRNMVLVDGIQMEKLFTNCPILDELCLVRYSGSKSEALRISTLSLKGLYISYCDFRGATMKIYAPNLSTISYTGSAAPEDFVVDSFPSLGEAVIDICSDVEYPAKRLILIKLFEKLSNIKVLKMSGDSFLVLSEAGILLSDLPAFDNLIHLEISSQFDCTSFGSVRILFSIFQLSPYLESIVFSKGIICTREEDDCWSFDQNCSLPHLRSVKFNNFNGMPKELDAIKLLLKYAGVLETMTIVASPCFSSNYEAQTKAMTQLLMFSRPINCVVKFLQNFKNI